MKISDAFEIAPKSENTLRRHGYEYKGLTFVATYDHPCEYDVSHKSKSLGMIKYYRGRKLAAYRWKED